MAGFPGNFFSEVKHMCVRERICWGGSVTELFRGIRSPLSLLGLMFTVGGREERTRWAKINLGSVWFHPPSTLSCFSLGLLDEKGEQLAGGKTWEWENPSILEEHKPISYFVFCQAVGENLACLINVISTCLINNDRIIRYHWKRI